MPKYETPCVLDDPSTGRGSEKYFICSRMVAPPPDKPQAQSDGKSGVMGIYLVDALGNEVLLYAESPSCFSPAMLAPHTRPPAIPTRRAYDDRPGLLYVADVYQGTHMAGVKRGAAKKLRIVESPEKRGWCGGKWFGQGFQAPGMNWQDFTAKRILGTVPVESDGSAYFEVPCDTFVYFQLLDENDLMVQSMRSGTVLQAGERTGCVGCHDQRLATPPTGLKFQPLALRREPSRIDPWYGKPRIFSYVGEVQPVFDKHCVSCHDLGKPAGEKLILAGDRDPFFNASYTQLWRKGYIHPVGAGAAGIQKAYSWGAGQSRIVQILRAGHNRVQLTKEELDRIATWIDINAPYYPTYYSAYPDNIAGARRWTAHNWDAWPSSQAWISSGRKTTSQAAPVRRSPSTAPSSAPAWPSSPAPAPNTKRPSRSSSSAGMPSPSTPAATCWKALSLAKRTRNARPSTTPAAPRNSASDRRYRRNERSTTMARDKDPAPTQSPIAHTDRAIVRTVHGRMIGSLSEAERDLLRRTNALLSEIALAGVQVDSVKAGTQILSKLRKTVYEDMNQLQHEALVLESARWLEEHVMNGKPGQWSWNPHQTGTIDDPDLECDFVGTRIVAEATTSLKPEGTIDSRMAATLSKLAEMSGDRYYLSGQRR